MSKVEQMITCPVCAKEVPFSRINQHLDKCSSMPSFSHSSTQSSKKRPNTSITNFFQANVSKKLKLQDEKPVQKTFVVCDDGDEQGPENDDDLFEVVQAQPSNISSTHTVDEGIDFDMSEKNAQHSVDTDKKSEPNRTYYEKIRHLPLSEKIRPKTLGEYVGQEHLLDSDTGILYRYLQTGKIPSMIFWGPPGVGKTTLARLLVKTVNEMNVVNGLRQKYKLVEISATKASVSDMKKIFENSKKEYHLTKYVTILFIDEIHRFNKGQQDVLLPSLENGEITLIGCTTENPSFQLNNALLSRCQVFVLKSLEYEDLVRVLETGVAMMRNYIPDFKFVSEDEEHVEGNGNSKDNKIFKYLISICNGDTRRLLNLLEMVITTTATSKTSDHVISLSEIEKLIKDNPSVYYYDAKGEHHYDYISALHKSIRGSDVNASLYYLARMLRNGEDPRYIARRMIRIASEDIGMVNNSMLPFSVATYEAVMKVGMPECSLALAQCCVLLCESPKSVKLYRTWNALNQMLESNEFGMGNASIPMHLRNAPTQLMKDLGYNENYKYNPDYKDGIVEQNYWPQEVLDKTKSKQDVLKIYENMEHLG